MRGRPWPRVSVALVGRLDVLAGPRCGGKARVLACIDEPEKVKKILAHLKLPTEALPLLPAGRPAEVDLPFGPRSVEAEPVVEVDVSELRA